jgi:phenylpropionate dioxygenase-like ring-hydroxylating dioxygenase large terminal subunit
VFLRNTWYVAAWADEVGAVPFGRKILGLPIVLFRQENGDIAALHDRCPHRFAPLSIGKVTGDAIECAYHGLRFDGAGACILNPHGERRIPNQAEVRSYPLVERFGAVWIWMGDPSRADASLIPNFEQLSDRANFASVTGYLRVAANYQLISDNLLDLSHVPYLHPLFKKDDTNDNVEVEMVQEGDTVHHRVSRYNQPTSKFQQMFGRLPSQRCDTHSRMRWNAPSLLLLDLRVIDTAGGPDLLLPNTHFITPETATTSHYFWGFAWNWRIDDRELAEKVRNVSIRVFEFEDKPVIEAQQTAIGQDELIALKPIMLAGDAAATRARRLLQNSIAAERGGTGRENLGESK